MKRTSPPSKRRSNPVTAGKKQPVKRGLFARLKPHKKAAAKATKNAVSAKKRNKLSPFVSRHQRGTLVHIQHTGRIIPHSATHYPLLSFLVLMVGAIMAVMSSVVSASVSDNYVVHAVVPGTIPTSPAVITTPVEDTHFTNVPITVSGTCSTNAAYIKLYRNDYFSGSALCLGGNFSLQSDLFQGANTLKAKVFNAADQEGPESTTVTVYNDHVDTGGGTNPGTGPGGGDGTGNNGSSGTGSDGSTGSPVGQGGNGLVSPPGAPLVLSADYSYRGYYVGDQIAWRLGIAGGKAPYVIHVDWGDGEDTLQKQPEVGAFSVSHTYTQPVKTATAYVIKISATDSQGKVTFVQIAALVTVPGVKGTGFTASAGSGLIPPTEAKGITGHLVAYAWPAYGVAVIMLASFWLGEHREFNLLRSSRTPKRLRHS